jgi:hypothetical protein
MSTNTRKAIVFAVVIVAIALLIVLAYTKRSVTPMVSVTPEPEDMSLPQVYSNSREGFALRLPVGYTTDESYTYENLGPNEDIAGVKFTIPSITAEGTNLSSDSYISIEQLPRTNECAGSLFLEPRTTETITDGDITYSVARAGGAAAGNLYEETVYALPGTNPCVAVRYFIHYGNFANYPEGAVKEFDKTALLKELDAIRRSLVVAQ